jgi:hypothetical protein
MDELMAAQFGMKTGKKTHRGRRSRGKGPKPETDDATPEASNHYADAQSHIKHAHAAPDPMATKRHLFKALTALKKC